MTKEEFSMFEFFLQYGNLEKASLVFVGMEEGLDTQGLDLAIKARVLLRDSKEFKDNRIFVNGENTNDGWFVNEALCLKQAQQLAEERTVTPLDELIPIYKSPPMLMQARLHWLLQGENRINYETMPNNFINYTGLNKPGGDSAMIDIFPFAKINSKDWPDVYKSVDGVQQFKNKSSYENYYLNNNTRIKIIKSIYDKYPMDCSIVYAGINQKEFRLKPMYEMLGFVFEEYDTGKINPIYKKYISPSDPPRPFLIGKRKRDDGKEQKAVLTPFFNYAYPTTCLSYKGLDAISTWV